LVLKDVFKRRIPFSWHQVDLEANDEDLAGMAAIQACSDGTATEDQQKRAIAFIKNRVCRLNEPSAVSDNMADTYHAEGRRFVGLVIQKAQSLNYKGFET
jgi:hypothetical protein